MTEHNPIEYNSIEEIFYQWNRDVTLNREKYCYENDKERLKKQARSKYRNLSEEEKIKRQDMQEIDIIIYLKKRNKN